jgi:hypothetical protein
MIAHCPGLYNHINGMELDYLHVVQELKIPLVLAHLAKSKLSFCHHFASVVYRPSLSSVNFSHFNLLL